MAASMRIYLIFNPQLSLNSNFIHCTLITAAQNTMYKCIKNGIKNMSSISSINIISNSDFAPWSIDVHMHICHDGPWQIRQGILTGSWETSCLVRIAIGFSTYLYPAHQASIKPLVFLSHMLYPSLHCTLCGNSGLFLALIVSLFWLSLWLSLCH